MTLSIWSRSKLAHEENIVGTCQTVGNGRSGTWSIFFYQLLQPNPSVVLRVCSSSLQTVMGETYLKNLPEA